MLPLTVQPTTIRLEASSACQLRCPSCPTTSGAARPVVGRGFLKFADFKALLDANPWLEGVELSNCGEIFVNPQLGQILEYAHGKGVKLHCTNGANLNDVTEPVLEAVVKYGLRRMTCSIDGASQASYEIYRVRGNFDQVIANVRRINHYKRIYQSKFPALVWQFVVFGHNEHEIDAARQMATELGMSFVVKLSWDSDFSPVRDKAAVRRATRFDSATREEFRARYGHDYVEGICAQLWQMPQINWDGKVLGCCRNFWGEFGGNAFSDGLLNVINSEPMQYARHMLRGDAPARSDIPCTTCDIYLGRQGQAGRIVGAPSTAQAKIAEP